MALEPLVERALVEAASRLSLSPQGLAKARRILEQVPNPPGGPLRDHVGAAAFIALVVTGGSTDESGGARRLGLSLSQLRKSQAQIAARVSVGILD